MPRRPTRSRSNQPTRKDIGRRLDDLSGGDYGDLETMTLADVIAHETEVIDEDAGVVRIVETGELRKQVDVDEEIMAGLKSVYSGGDDE